MAHHLFQGEALTHQSDPKGCSECSTTTAHAKAGRRGRELGALASEAEVGIVTYPLIKTKTLVGSAKKKLFFATFPMRDFYHFRFFKQNDRNPRRNRDLGYARFWALEYVSSGAYLRGDIGRCPPPLGAGGAPQPRSAPSNGRRRLRSL